jgi:hypothetical protein
VDAAGDGAVRAVYCSVGGVGRRRCRRQSGKNGNRKVTDRAAVVLAAKDVPLFFATSLFLGVEIEIKIKIR